MTVEIEAGTPEPITGALRYIVTFDCVCCRRRRQETTLGIAHEIRRSYETRPFCEECKSGSSSCAFCSSSDNNPLFGDPCERGEFTCPYCHATYTRE